ncbi:YncE family protein, partial [Hellea sp.]|nr:YncE family protein [Hellea sp.]
LLCLTIAVIELSQSAYAAEPVPEETASASYLLVGNKGDDSVSFINLATGREEARRLVSAKAPHEIAASPDGGAYAAVVNYGSAAIDIFDVKARTIIQTYDLGENKNPHGIVWLDDGRILATTEGGKSIVIISNAENFQDRKVSAISTGEDGTHMLAISSDGKYAYTANLGSGTLSKIDVANNVTLKTVPAGDAPEGIDITNDNQEIWVSARGSNEVYVYEADTLTELATIPVGNFPLRLAISPDGKKAVTSNLADGTLSVLDIKSRKLERVIKVSGSNQAAQVTVIFSPDGSRLYVAETGVNKIAEIDFETGELLGRLAGSIQGDGLAIVTP